MQQVSTAAPAATAAAAAAAAACVCCERGYCPSPSPKLLPAEKKDIEAHL